MTNKLDKFKEKFTKKDNPEIKIGDIVKVHLKLAEKTKAGGDKIQVFEGLVIAKKHGKGMDGTFTVRKIAEGIGAEKIFPLHCPTISKIEVIKHSKVRRAKLYYMRGRVGKKARMSALKGTDLAEGGSAQKVTTEK